MNPSVMGHLAWGAIKALAAMAWQDAPGDEVFMAEFQPEGLVALDAKGRDLAPGFGRCLGCGACEHLSCSPRAVLGDLRWLGDPSAASPRIRALTDTSDDRLAEMETACPAGIRFRALATMFRSHA